MIEIYAHEYKVVSQKLIGKMLDKEITVEAFSQAVVHILELLQNAEPKNPEFAAKRAEFYHLDGSLRQAGKLYKHVLELAPPEELKQQELDAIRRYCPMLLTTPKECFPLKDIIAVHHPDRPLIGYHLFWEDDYDFPDDYEPCDHEEIWVEYDPHQEVVMNVMTFFHSYVIESKEAAIEAGENNQRPIIRIEWGKHGSLLKGWEEIQIPMREVSALEWIKETYEHVQIGGRAADHPLKRFWPVGFEGTFAEYTDFSVPVDPLELLDRKPLMFKSHWVNAIIFTQGLLYNFHPKMEWPERFIAAEQTQGVGFTRN
ncbi:hypothetical protein EHS13_07540 [Paenibacillus psychroresistens]|uniref:Uncharacterized protein n=1 Tax=Paenibacillus psychroresistens TaxID=1778678 RepID=A0A6B8RG93_9BACL|nr:hypothetical protein [Paenibacillus psychroresistens]QGQ94744.1 hypothetical protein EHS13_07540 [Paenibacillus psychroresistens]